jgi:hypothetical protein
VSDDGHKFEMYEKAIENFIEKEFESEVAEAGMIAYAEMALREALDNAGYHYHCESDPVIRFSDGDVRVKIVKCCKGYGDHHASVRVYYYTTKGRPGKTEQRIDLSQLIRQLIPRNEVETH